MEMPEKVASELNMYMNLINDYNDGVREAAERDDTGYQDGRYEWEYRKKYERGVISAMFTAAAIYEEAIRQRCDLRYCHGYDFSTPPCIIPWSEEAWEWECRTIQDSPE